MGILAGTNVSWELLKKESNEESPLVEATSGLGQESAGWQNEELEGFGDLERALG